MIPYCMSKIFLSPLDVLQNSSAPTPHPPPPHTHTHHLIIKAAKLVSVFEAEIDHPLGLLKVKAGNLRGILIVVRVKLQNLHHINIVYTTDKKSGGQLPFIPSYFPCYGNRAPWQQRSGIEHGGTSTLYNFMALLAL